MKYDYVPATGWTPGPGYRTVTADRAWRSDDHGTGMTSVVLLVVAPPRLPEIVPAADGPQLWRLITPTAGGLATELTTSAYTAWHVALHDPHLCPLTTCQTPCAWCATHIAERALIDGGHHAGEQTLWSCSSCHDLVTWRPAAPGRGRPVSKRHAVHLDNTPLCDGACPIERHRAVGTDPDPAGLAVRAAAAQLYDPSHGCDPARLTGGLFLLRHLTAWLRSATGPFGGVRSMTDIPAAADVAATLYRVSADLADCAAYLANDHLTRLFDKPAASPHPARLGTDSVDGVRADLQAELRNAAALLFAAADGAARVWADLHRAQPFRTASVGPANS